MIRLVSLSIIFSFQIWLAFYTALAQPGLCACWLIADVKNVHFHPPGLDPHKPHAHDYLFELYRVVPASVAPHLESARELIQRLAAHSLWRPITGGRVLAHGWRSIPEPPPPRT